MLLVFQNIFILTSLIALGILYSYTIYRYNLLQPYMHITNLYRNDYKHKHTTNSTRIIHAHLCILATRTVVTF